MFIITYVSQDPLGTSFNSFFESKMATKFTMAAILSKMVYCYVHLSSVVFS